jgi:hypothetical protein
MKLKSLLFGSAAVIAAGTGAQAADLPIVEPVDYVRICDAFGDRFYYIPGTDICLRVAGRVRVESHYFDGDPPGAAGFAGAAGVAEINNWTTRARGYIFLDSRAQTDIGLVRAYISTHFTVGPAGATPQGTASNPNYGGTNLDLEQAFISISNDWGTYTAGHAYSFFELAGINGMYGYYSPRTGFGVDASDTFATLFAWTFAGGNGFSFTVSAEDPSSSFRRLNGDDDYEGQEAPDGVANIRVDQGWGSAQVSGAVRHIHDVNGDGIGFAVAGALGVNLPGGWRASGMGGYSEGAIGYITNDFYGRGMGDFDGPTGNQQNRAWVARGGITGPVATNINVWAGGSFTHVEEADCCAAGDEYDRWGVLVGAAWNPVNGLTMGPEFSYTSHNLTDRAGDGLGESTLGDFDIWSLMWRIQRDF